VNDVGKTKVLIEEASDGHQSLSHTAGQEQYTDENEIGYEQFSTVPSKDLGENDYDQRNANQQPDHDGLASAEAAQGDTETVDDNASLDQYGEGATDLDHGYSAEQGDNVQGAIASFGNDDIEFEIGDVTFQHEIKHDNDLPELSETNGTASVQEDASKASSLDVIETAESSVTLGADEIQYEDDLHEEVNIVTKSGQSDAPGGKASTEKAAVVQQKDEIDYEDDDDEAELPLQSQVLVQEVQASQNANGKRSIAEIEFNDTSTLEIKGTFWLLYKR
jgi:hypothetical protein